MAKSAKVKRIYDRGIIYCPSESPPFSFVPLNLQLDNGKTFDQAVAKKINVYKKIEELRHSTPVSVLMNGSEKEIFYFARIEQGFEHFRVDMAVKMLNDEIMKYSEEEWVEIYRTHMVDDFFERLEKDIHYEMRNPITNTFDFNPWNKVRTRFSRDTSRSAGILTDDNAGSDINMPNPSQHHVRPKTRKAIDEAKIAEEKAREIRAKLDQALAEKAEERRRQTAAHEQMTLPPATTSQWPMTSSASLPGSSATTPLTLGGYKIIPSSDAPVDFSSKRAVPLTIEEIKASMSATSSMSSWFPETMPTTVSQDLPADIFEDVVVTQPGESRYVNITAADVLPIPANVLVTAATAPTAPTTSSTMMGSDDNNNESTSEPNQPPMPTQVEGEEDSVSASDLVTKAFLKREMTQLLRSFQEVMEAHAQEITAEIREAVNDKYQKLDKKIDNKFGYVLEIKRDVKGLNNKIVGVSEQVAKASPKKSVSMQIQTETRGRYILLRLIPFNYMGKACDVFFASPLVQEQLCAFITPYLQKMQLAGINFTLAKTCVVTCFTPLARAHLIYGKIDNSIKNLVFYKRPLPEGLHNMVDKFLVLAIEQMFNLSPLVHRNNISDLRKTCTTLFSTDRKRYLQLAVDSFDNVEDAAHKVADEDYRFHEHNKHILKSSVSISSYNQHLDYIMNRGQFKNAKKSQEAGAFTKTRNVDPNHVFDELKSSCVKEELDVKEVLKRICAAAHCFKRDFRTLEFDALPSVPQLPRLYNEVVEEIGDNINDLLNFYSSEGTAYKPEVFIGTINSPKKALDPTALPSTSGKTSAKRKLEKAILTDSDDDDDSGSNSSKKRKSSPDPDSDEEPQKKKKNPASIPPAHPGTSGARIADPTRRLTSSSDDATTPEAQ